MGAPIINISFIEKARTIFQRSERGTVGLVLKDKVTAGQKKEFTVQYEDDIPSYLSAFNKEQIKLALLGNVTAPKKVMCYVMDTTSSSTTIDVLYTGAKKWITSNKIHYLAIPTVDTDSKLDDMITFIKSEYDNSKNKVFAIFPFKTTEKHEAIIGCEFTGYTSEVTHTATSGTYKAEEYCSRIAGFLAGTPMTQSITYGTLPDLIDCNRLSNTEIDTAVDAGKLVLMHDGEKVKIVRGVNTFITTTATKGESYKKIKIVNIINFLFDDLVKLIRDQYIGKFNNDYDSKCVLITAVNSYFKQIISNSIITKGECEIDLDAQRTYLISKGIDVSDMKDQDILKADTGSIVYLTGKVGIPDAIEDVEFPIYL